MIDLSDNDTNENIKLIIAELANDSAFCERVAKRLDKDPIEFDEWVQELNETID